MDLTQTLLIALGFTTIILVIVTVLIIFMNQSKKIKYDNEFNLSKIDDMRRYYESKIMEINEKLTSNYSRFKDTNHLLLSEQNRVDHKYTTNEELANNIFLVNHGITKQDLLIDKKSVFVLTPFIDSKLELFQQIKNICNGVGLKCGRGDEEYIKSDILPHILKKIVQARIIIANIDGRNPNVFYELGIAHALGKPTLLITQSIQEVPFDLKSKSLIIYTNDADLEIKLTQTLTKLIIENE